MTRAFGGANLRRNAHLRSCASSKTNSFSRNAWASGMPGAPPPEPTSTTGSPSPRTSSRPRRESSSSTRLASETSAIAVRPGVATTAASQRSSGADDDVPVRLRALARRLDPVELLQAHVDDLPLDRRHRLEIDRLARSARALCASHREPLQHGAPALAVTGRIHGHLDALAPAARDDRVDDVLHCVDRLPVAADQHPDVAACALDVDAVCRFAHADPAVDTELGDDLLDERAHVGSQLALLLRRLARAVAGRIGSRCDDPRRRIADAEQAALALGDDFEANRGLVDPGPQPLELAQRCPLRLADRLPRRFDEQLLGHRRARFFFLRTTRGCPVGFGGGSAGVAPSPSPPRCFRGVRELRFGVGTGFGASRRVTRPCPTVQRFVVIQYRTRPVGKFAISGMNAIGSTIMIQRCVLSIVADMKYVEEIWLAA